MSTTWENQDLAGEQFMAAGWYIDPADPRVRRRWDGYGWTAETVPAPPRPVRTERRDLARSIRRLGEQSSLSLITLAVCAAYLLVDNYTNLSVFGVIPISLSIRAMTRREPLAVLAVAATVIAVAAPFILIRY